MQKIKNNLKSKFGLFKKITLLSSCFLIALILYMGIVFVYAWEEPSGIPPSSNVPAPIHVGDDRQTIQDSKTLTIKSDGTGILSVEGGLNIVGIGAFGDQVGVGVLPSDMDTDVMLEAQGGSIKATDGLIIETRNSDPVSPEVGRIWLRTDL